MRDALVPLLDKHFAEFSGAFEWGVRDCALFAAGWVKAVTRRVLIPEHLAWNDESSAAQAIAATGAANMRELTDRLLPRCELLRARIGDIVGRDTAIGFALGICTGPDAVFIERRTGLTRFALSRCSACWAVD